MSSTPTRPHATRDRPPPTRHLLVVTPLAVAACLVVVGGYGLHWGWTGYRDADGELRRLWDWLTLLVLPVTLALLPLLLDARDRRRRRLVVAATAAVLFGALVVCSYALHWAWTGFQDNTLWDWLGLFLVPFAVPVAFSLLGRVETAGRRSDAPPVDDAETRRTPSLTAEAPGNVHLPLLLLGAAVVVVLLAVAYGVGRAAAPEQAASIARTSTAPSSPVSVQVTIDGRDASWTDTHLSVTRGELLEIEAGGLVKPGAHYPWVGPDGLAGTLNVVLSHVPHEALIAMVAPARRSPGLAGGAPAGATLVGSRRVFRAQRDGDLYLAPNDRRTTDNAGWFAATVTPMTS